jgi:hypothetical protein
MNDLFLYALAFFIGAIASRLYFGLAGPDAFEQGLMRSLAKGSRVIISVDNKSLIFEMNDGKVKITEGTTDYEEGEYNGISTDDLGASSTDKSVSSTKDSSDGA